MTHEPRAWFKEPLRLPIAPPEAAHACCDLMPSGRGRAGRSMTTNRRAHSTSLGVPRWGTLTVCVLSLMLSPSASATAVDPRVSTQPPLDLPGDKATGFRAHKATWIVAGRRGRTTSAIAKRFHTRPIASHLGVFEVSIADARAFAAELRGRGLLAFAEPNVVRQRQDKPTEPLSGSSNSWWRSAVVSPEVVAPAIAANSPLLGVIDSQIDLTHPEFAGGGVTALYDTAVDHWHGTAVTASPPRRSTGPALRVYGRACVSRRRGTTRPVPVALARSAMS